MTRSFRYRLVPSRAQAAVMFEWLRLTCELYNAALQERRDAWVKQRISISRFDQQAQLPAVRVARPEFVDVPVIVMRGAVRRLDKSFTAFFRRCKSGETPGFPRFKSTRRWSCLEFDNPLDGSPIVAGGKRIKVPLLGKVKLKLHRPLEGRPRTMKIKLDGDGHWYVSIVCDSIATRPLLATGKSIGVDLGLLAFAATSDGEIFKNPRPLRAARLLVERASRRVSRRKMGSRRRQVAVRLLARKHVHITNIRRQNHIDVARSLVTRYDTIYVEALNIKGLARGVLAKSVNDAAWGGFLKWLDVKAESAARRVVEVNPAGTSKTCSRCGRIAEMPLSVRVFHCPECGLVIDRDVNAGINIKSLGMSEQGAAPRLSGRQRSAKCTTTALRSGHAFRTGCQ